MKEYNLLSDYSQKKAKRFVGRGIRTIEHRIIASERELSFFDGDRNVGYGGFSYNPRFWTDVVRDMADFYKLKSGDKILDIGCAKGFMLYHQGASTRMTNLIESQLKH